MVNNSERELKTSRILHNIGVQRLNHRDSFNTGGFEGMNFEQERERYVMSHLDSQNSKDERNDLSIRKDL